MKKIELKIPTKEKDLRLSTDEQKRLILPVILTGLMVLTVIILHGLDPRVPMVERKLSLLIGICGAVYTSTFFFIVLPNINKIPALKWIMAIIDGVVLGALLGYGPTYIGNTWLIVVNIFLIGSAVLLGRWPTYLFAVITTLIDEFLGNGLSIPQDFGTWINLLNIPILSIVVTESVLQMQSVILRQMRRLRTLNNMAHSLASSLEKNEIINLISTSIQDAMEADTYYLGSLTEKGDAIHLDLLYDEGVFFPPEDIDLQNSLIGWVASNRQSLLIRDYLDEARQRGLEPSTIGKPKLSRSWIGIPLETQGHLLGVLAVASYQPNTYKAEDMDLLQNLGQQIAMAMDNASHHEEVERQSRLDSLTKVLNHGAFLQALSQAMQDTQINNVPLTLIMLDIDHFKMYNDMYGHLCGDDVLYALVEAIRKHIKSTDLVGRWGGEEFCVALLKANGSQSYGVANRVRNTLKELVLFGREGQNITPPTISQGIATIEEANEVYALIDLADQRLYVAKERGRDSIEPGPDFFPPSNLADN